MKKLLTLVLVLAMALTLTVSVFAAETIEGAAGTQDVPVNVTVANDAAEIVYYVVVTWENLDFTYTYGADRGWNTSADQQHGYTGTFTGSGWGAGKADSATGTITVENHSNVDVTVSQNLVKVAGGNTLNVVCDFADGSDANVAAAVVGTAWTECDTAVFEVTVSGTPDQALTTQTKVATVTVRID